MIGPVEYLTDFRYTLAEQFLNAELERDEGHGAALAAAPELEKHVVALNIEQYDGSSVSGNGGVDRFIEDLLDLSLDNVG